MRFTDIAAFFPRIWQYPRYPNRNSHIVGVPVAWQSTSEQKVAVGGGRLRTGSGAGSERSFTGRGYRDSSMVGIRPYRVAFERGVGRVERAVCAAERPAECAVRPIQIS